MAETKLWGVLITLYFPLCVNSRCEEGNLDMFVAHMYQLTGCGLTQVPTDIPAEATWVRLDNNEISVIPPAALSNITRCTILWLSGNKLINISAGVFENLSQLTVLNLENNKIRNIQSGAFAKLTAMRVLNLQGNALTTLERDVFGKLYPTYLTLLLSRNPLECDSRMCWIKQFQRNGWITLNYIRADNFSPKPDCTNYPDQNWENVTLRCPSEGNTQDSPAMFFVAGGTAAACSIMLCFVIVLAKFLRRRLHKKNEKVSGTQYPRHYVTKLPHQEIGRSNYDTGSCDGRLYQNVEDSDDIYDDVEETQT